MPAFTPPATTAAPQLIGLPPVIANDTKILILGSFPGEASLVAQQYYAHPRNQFWLLMAEVIGVPLPILDYQTRLAALLDNRIGLWDVVAEALRTGSLDSNIQNLTSNNLVSVVSNLPQLRAIAFNGGTATKSNLPADIHGHRQAPSHQRQHALLTYSIANAGDAISNVQIRSFFIMPPLIACLCSLDDDRCA